MIPQILIAVGLTLGGAVATAVIAGEKKKKDYLAINTTEKSLRNRAIFVCGGCGVGKSSIINDIVLSSANNVIESNATDMIEAFTDTDAKLTVFDSEGYALSNAKRYRDTIVSFLKANKVDDVWYCINAGCKRFTQTDNECIRDITDIVGAKHVCVILTKADEVDENELRTLRETIHKECPQLSMFSYYVKKSDKNDKLYNSLSLKNKELLLRRVTI